MILGTETAEIAACLQMKLNQLECCCETNLMIYVCFLKQVEKKTAERLVCQTERSQSEKQQRPDAYLLVVGDIAIVWRKLERVVKQTHAFVIGPETSVGHA